MQTVELINWAWNLSGIKGRQFETVTGQESSDGLTLLNDILAGRNSDGRYISYYERFDISAVIGQEDYWVDNLVEVDTATVTLDEVRYPLMYVDRNTYWGEGRVNNITALPYSYYSERQINSDTNIPGTRLWFYWLPAQSDYTFQVVGRFSLQKLTLSTVISNHLEGYYIDYLKYKLAKRMCDFYDYEFGQSRMQELTNLEMQVNDINPIDTRVKKITPFTGDTVFNWADVNIGRGWRP